MTKAERLRERLDGCLMPTLKECEDIVRELDKPELSPGRREILISLQANRGAVMKIDGTWLWMDYRGGSSPTKTPWGNNRNEIIIQMFSDGLLSSYGPMTGSGMTNYGVITSAAITALG